MAHQATVELLSKNLNLLAGLDPEVEAKRWDWATVSQVREWIEYGSCARGDVARALRNVGCTPLMCSLQVTTVDGGRKAIGLLAAEGKITVQEARRLAISDSK